MSNANTPYADEEIVKKNIETIEKNDDESPQISAPPTVAGGLKAVLSSLQHTQKQLGVFKGVKTLTRLNQKRGLDCPGCAWPDPAERSIAEFCENGAKAVADEATNHRLTADFFQQHSIADLKERSGRWLNAQGRLTEPLLRRPDSDHYEPIGWDDAFDLIAKHLNGLDSPHEAVFYTSGRTSNEAAFLYQLFVRAFGTNNLPDCSNMCHESSGVGLSEAIGIGKGTVLLEDFQKADAIFVFGQNPGTNHPRMMTALQEAKRAGAKIVTINPLKEAGLTRFKHPQEVSGILGSGTPLTDLYLQVNINGDVALLKGIMKVMLAEEAKRPGEVLDHAFIDTKTAGFDAFRQNLEAANWDAITNASGISREDIEAAAHIAIDSDATIACWAMGLTQHKNAVANIQEVVNFLLLRGQIGKPGAGACPVRGHSNVQGDRTMGIWDRPSEAFLQSLDTTFGFTSPREHGFDVVHAIDAMRTGQARVFVALGGNFLSASPDTNLTATALQNCDLTVQISTKLNRSHLYTGQSALILPCLARTERDQGPGGEERFVTVENSMGIVHRSQGHLPPASDHLLSEPDIVARLAHHTLNDRPDLTIPWLDLSADYDHIRDAIEEVIPGFEFFNRRIRKAGGFALPNPPRQGTFPTHNGKANFTVHPIAQHKLGRDQYMMMTIRSHDQFNTTVYTNDDRYRGIKGGRRILLMNPDDIHDAGLASGQHVDLLSHYDDERIAPDFSIVPYDLPRQTVATYFPEANVLIPLSEYAERSHTPASKSIVISLRPR